MQDKAERQRQHQKGGSHRSTLVKRTPRDTERLQSKAKPRFSRGESQKGKAQSKPVNLNPSQKGKGSNHHLQTPCHEETGD